jgi:hypothetical protein
MTARGATTTTTTTPTLEDASSPAVSQAVFGAFHDHQLDGARTLEVMARIAAVLSAETAQQAWRLEREAILALLDVGPSSACNAHEFTEDLLGRLSDSALITECGDGNILPLLIGAVELLYRPGVRMSDGHTSSGAYCKAAWMGKSPPGPIGAHLPPPEFDDMGSRLARQLSRAWFHALPSGAARVDREPRGEMARACAAAIHLATRRVALTVWEAAAAAAAAIGADTDTDVAMQIGGGGGGGGGGGRRVT